MPLIVEPTTDIHLINGGPDMQVQVFVNGLDRTGTATYTFDAAIVAAQMVYFMHRG
ncbi:MAG: hypothetical protein IIA45_13855 [Bacteroidetes bacterium]|nr:hypothetical protein [Bacteroidota bacterium]